MKKILIKVHDEVNVAQMMTDIFYMYQLKIKAISNSDLSSDDPSNYDTCDIHEVSFARGTQCLFCQITELEELVISSEELLAIAIKSHKHDVLGLETIISHQKMMLADWEDGEKDRSLEE